jgi:alkylation response protein AidB-like acyl-CoA dehydrogenase
MSGDRLVEDAAAKLFGDLVTPKLLDGAEAGDWPQMLWGAVTEAGFCDALAADGLGGIRDAVAILRVAGRHAAPIPLAETMLGRWLVAASGGTPSHGPLTLAPVEPAESITAHAEGDARRLVGRAAFIPWARDAMQIVVHREGAIFVLDRGDVTANPGRNLAGEPRDHIEIDRAAAPLDLPREIDGALIQRLGALFRAAQMAGALEGVLALATRYANDRIQFGRPIGKFQAIQQQLAQLAEEVAAAGVAVSAAAQQTAKGGDTLLAAAAAKVRAGEAAGKAAEIAHQVHGAIGFTHEHGLHRLTRRLWSWRDEFGSESWWSEALGRHVAAQGAAGFWPMMTT